MLTIKQKQSKPEVSDIQTVRQLCLDIMAAPKSHHNGHARISAGKLLLEIGDATAGTQERVDSLWNAITAPRDTVATTSWTKVMTETLETFVRQNAAGCTMGELRSEFHQYSTHQIKYAIRKLEKVGRIERTGAGKGTVYLSPELPEAQPEPGESTVGE